MNASLATAGGPGWCLWSAPTVLIKRKIRCLAPGERALVVPSCGDWALIFTQGDFGWVRLAALKGHAR